MAVRTWVVKAYLDVALWQTVHYQSHVEGKTLSDFIEVALREALERRGVKVSSLAAILEGQREMELSSGGAKVD